MGTKKCKVIPIKINPQKVISKKGNISAKVINLQNQSFKDHVRNITENTKSFDRES